MGSHLCRSALRPRRGQVELSPAQQPGAHTAWTCSGRAQMRSAPWMLHPGPGDLGDDRSLRAQGPFCDNQRVAALCDLCPDRMLRSLSCSLLTCKTRIMPCLTCGVKINEMTCQVAGRVRCKRSVDRSKSDLNGFEIFGQVMNHTGDGTQVHKCTGPSLFPKTSLSRVWLESGSL